MLELHPEAALEMDGDEKASLRRAPRERAALAPAVAGACPDPDGHTSNTASLFPFSSFYFPPSHVFALYMQYPTTTFEALSGLRRSKVGQ